MSAAALSARIAVVTGPRLESGWDITTRPIADGAAAWPECFPTRTGSANDFQHDNAARSRRCKSSLAISV